LDIVKDLRDRRGLFQLMVQMTVKVGIECEKAGMDTEAKESFAATYMMMGQMDEIDQALAAIEQRSMRSIEVDIVCTDCGVVQNQKAVLNVLMPPESQELVQVNCSSCGKVHIGDVRNDSPDLPKGYSLTIYGVLDSEREERTFEERRPEALALGKGTEANPDDLPPVVEMKAMLWGETLGSPVSVQHGVDTKNGQVENIRSKLDAAKALMPGADSTNDEDDF